MVNLCQPPYTSIFIPLYISVVSFDEQMDRYSVQVKGTLTIRIELWSLRVLGNGILPGMVFHIICRGSLMNLTFGLLWTQT